MKNKGLLKTCRYCTASTTCRKRMNERFKKFGEKLYNATIEQEDQLDRDNAKHCLDFEEVYHG